ncbi:MAG: nicotinate-nucleotide adenylyltransferase [Gemmatimonadaceae bacterium]
MRLGIFGGTFDPPHAGHLLVASDACDLLSLDKLVFVPAGAPRFKMSSVEASPEQRLKMLELMIAGDGRFAVDSVEINRKGLSYTLDTLVWFAEQFPLAERFLLIGADLVEQFPTWREPDRILALAKVVVLDRLTELASADVVHGHGIESGFVGAVAPAGFLRLGTRVVQLSSTEVRSRVRAGKPIHGFVSDAVGDYIRKNGLYQIGIRD